MTLKELCSTTIPDLDYAAHVDPNKNENKMNFTVVSKRLNHNRFCKSVTHLDFDLDKHFDCFVEEHDRNATIKPLIVEENMKPIEEENDMNSYIGQILLYPFFKRVSSISRKTSDKKHIITYENKQSDFLFVINNLFLGQRN